MNWDQIEIKWTEMANRVRADIAKPAADAGRGATRDKAAGSRQPEASAPAEQPNAVNAE